MAGQASHRFKLARLERRLGRYELMSWINSFLRIDYTKVEEFSDGIAYCQVVDALIPDSVPLHKLAFHPSSKEEKIRNLKVLDRALAKEKLSKALDVMALASGNFQENNEMLQWCYAMVQRNCPHVVTTYKALEKRVAAMKRQKYSPSSKASSSLEALTNRLIPSEVGMSLLFGESPNEGDSSGTESKTGDGAAEAIRDAEIALLRAKLTPSPHEIAGSSPNSERGGGELTLDSGTGSDLSDYGGQDYRRRGPGEDRQYQYPQRSLHQSFDRSAGADDAAGGLTPEEEEKRNELQKIEDVLLEIEETLVLRLKAFDKLREKVSIEKARGDFFHSKLVSLEQLCELMPYSAKSDACRRIILAGEDDG
ncbi:microtubule plus-end binding protein [Chloropicon primus]|uniref:Microtubule plus-end binding protein n=1 Tax=Chloropicon primus TaxID=1764295 RepID=A0A5B8MJN3_9CHLO|nr:microtubule plus-end binding protein [Chloropicon primus]UPQ99701.1 microtubule plus-end binding protein [Chloropicon primus]|eukprot:QDZ20491.1 microtubule plus-end binding protein [Chloropicon primus]